MIHSRAMKQLYELLVFQLLLSIQGDVKKLMADFATLSAEIDQISTAIDTHLAQDAATIAADTTTIADLNAQIAALQAELAAGGMTPDQEAQIQAKLDVLLAKVSPPPLPS